VAHDQKFAVSIGDAQRWVRVVMGGTPADAVAPVPFALQRSDDWSHAVRKQTRMIVDTGVCRSYIVHCMDHALSLGGRPSRAASLHSWEGSKRHPFLIRDDPLLLWSRAAPEWLRCLRFICLTRGSDDLADPLIQLPRP
jgi:hypothetical protein